MNGLVLSGGGARSAYQVGVLAYLVEKAREVSFPIVTGVSAGAINAAFIAGHRGPAPQTLESLSRCWTSLTTDRIFNTNLGSLGLKGARWFWTLGGAGATAGAKGRALLNTEPLREFLTDHLDVEGIDANIAAGRLRALALTATRYSTGRTVTFVHGHDDAPDWERARREGVRAAIGVEHVMASGSLPLIFPAVKIEGDYYGDGSIRQAAPLGPAIQLGADQLLAISTRYRRTKAEAAQPSVTGYPPPAQLLGLLFNTIFLDTLDADAERLQRINRLLRALPPDTPRPAGLNRIRLALVRPSRDLGKLAEGYKRLLPRSVRFLLRGLGVHRIRGPDLLSYLIFEAPYINRVMELGYEDALSNWSAIERFFADGA